MPRSKGNIDPRLNEGLHVYQLIVGNNTDARLSRYLSTMYEARGIKMRGGDICVVVIDIYRCAGRLERTVEVVPLHPALPAEHLRQER